MAFKQVCTSLLVAVACCSVLSKAQQLSYLSDNNQNGFPFGNQGSLTYLNDNTANQLQSLYPIQAQQLSYLSDNNQNGFPFSNQGSFTYLRDNGANQVPAVYSAQSGPVNYINNIGNPQIQTIGAYPNVISSVGLIGNNGFGGSNIINNVNSGLSTVQYPGYAQTLPVYNQIVSYPSAQQVLPVAQYVPQPSIVGGSVGYPNNNNQITNTQSAPVEINFGSQQPCLQSTLRSLL
ncbi:uncharacterized protein LOC123302387 [Chrysoperla carnea]|uniref:uncharacterized protein LOC123302387 n=1 Tax=Chrysoperla carnea TaxID=189513 RepID=UPI001D09022A|nr:uncharacterized protein LOC123302387 [Chrysoperla carnea]